ncbi:DUF6879 family protein [Streptomyces sp. NPDC002055]|uniref:DUF6879 family protein n=1 Tax=Streptomyces sp. NPDC002055 TaxID=3154534 RepID=UPI00332429B5
MANLTPFTEVKSYFKEFEHTAWRLETQRGYASDRAGEKWQRFLRGEHIAYDPTQSWQANVRLQTEAGKRFERVRLVDSPPTEGQRFLLRSGLANVEAGEDIRNLYRSDARRIGLPDYDFWLFDSRTVVKFSFDDEGNNLGVEVIEDAATVLAACQIRDVAWHYAVPTIEFQTQLRSTV